MGRLGDIEAAIVELRARVEAYKPMAGLNTSVSDAQGGSGRVINARFTPVTPAVAETHPFELIDASNPSDGTQVRVVYGTVGGVQPDGMSPGDVPPYIIAIGGATGFVYLVCTTDDDYILNDVSIDTGATVPTDDETTHTYYLPIGSFAIDGGTVSIAQGISGSQGFKWCGSALFALS